MIRARAKAAWWAAAGAGFIVTGQFYLGQGLPRIDAVLFLAVGMFLFWRASGLVPPPRTFTPAVAGRSLTWSRGASVACFGAAMMAGLAVSLASRPGFVPVQVLVVMLGAAWVTLGVALGGNVRAGVSAALGAAGDRLRRDGPWLLAILALAASVRFTGLEALPAGIWYDEAAIGLEGRRILEEQGYRPLYAPSTTSPAGYVYLVAFAEAVLGGGAGALRAVSALAGVASTALAYVAGGLLWGRWAGLGAAALFAMARWDLNFSRIAMQGATTPALLLGAFAAGLLALRTGHPAAYAATGVVLGSSLWFYGANVFFIPATLLAVILAERARPGFVRGSWQGLLLAALGMLAVAAPVILDAAVRSDVVLDRAHVVSVFTGRSLGEVLPEIEASAGRHLAMFHVQGDMNGRHNLPGHPMLDAATGGLMLLGVAASLQGQGGPLNGVLLAWLCLLLLPGILSVPEEAPQGLRSIGALPAALLLAVLGIDRLRQLLSRGLTARMAGVLAAAPIVVAAALNGNTYFRLQAADPGVWQAFSMPETFIGRRLAQADAGEPRQIVSPLFDNQPTIGFLTDRTYSTIDPARDLPLSDAADTEIFLDPREEAVALLVMAFYPGAGCDAVRNNPEAPVILYHCRVSETQIRDVRGLEQVGEEFRGSLQAPVHGPFRLALDAPNSLSWTLDGRLMGRGSQPAAEVFLPQGLHEVRVRPVAGSGAANGASARFLWQQPGGAWEPIPQERLFHDTAVPMGLDASYFHGEGWGGPAALRRMEPGASTYYHILPLPLPFSAEFAGMVHARVSGPHRFSLEAISTATLDIGGQAVARTTAQNTPAVATVVLNQGWHQVRVRYLAAHGYAHVFLRWQPPGQPRLEPIPPELMRPW